MTTVSRVNTVSHSSVSGGGEWDHRLNRLLEDLQETVVPPETRANASEYREYRVTTSSRNNDEPASQTDEKWVEYGTRHPAPGFGTGHSYNIDSGLQAINDSAYGGSRSTTTEKTVNFSDDFSKSFTGGGHFTSSSDKSQSRHGHVEYLTPANATTVLRSGPSSPSNVLSSTSSTSPKVERKEYFSKASYTALIKGGPGEVPQEMIPRSTLPEPSFTPRQSGLSSSSLSETRRTFTSDSTRVTSSGGGDLPPPPPAIGQPLYSSTPLKSSSYSSREVNTLNSSLNRSVTPPPKPADGLKTPPLVRKILQQSANSSSTNYNSSRLDSSKLISSSSTTSTSGPLGRPPLSSSPGIPSYDEPPPEPKGPRYYTATTTSTEHRENRELSPVKRFPSPQPPRGDYGGPPKRLDELMATFEDSSYTSTRHISGDGGGPHESHPYGPGTHHVDRPMTQTRTVRIDESATTRRIIDDETDLHQRRSNYQNPAYGGKDNEPSRNVSGPPVFYPTNQIFPKTEEDALLSHAASADKTKKPKKEPKREKLKANKGDDKGSGAVPVPVCLPVCCAAPCSIM